MHEDELDPSFKPIPPKQNKIVIMPSELDWEDYDGILSTAVEIWNVCFHISAIEVDAEGEAVNEVGARELKRLRSFFDGETVPFDTVELLPGRQFVPYLMPGQDLSRAKADSITLKLLKDFQQSEAESIEEFAKDCMKKEREKNKGLLTVEEGMAAFHSFCKEGFLVPGSIDPDGEIRWRLADDVKAFALSGQVDLGSPDALDRLRALRKLRTQN